MRKALFQINDGLAYIGYTNGDTWNGWATPYFEKDEAMKIISEINEHDEIKSYYDAETDTFRVYSDNIDGFEDFEGNDVETPDGIKHLYGIGAYFWIWDEIEGGTTMTTINEGNYGENLYRVFLGTGTAWLQEFYVYAYNETEAVDMVADYCEDNELHGLYSDYYDLADLCESGETVDEYAEANGLTCCGNHGIYLDVAGLEEIK